MLGSLAANTNAVISQRKDGKVLVGTEGKAKLTIQDKDGCIVWQDVSKKGIRLVRYNLEYLPDSTYTFIIKTPAGKVQKTLSF